MSAGAKVVGGQLDKQGERVKKGAAGAGFQYQQGEEYFGFGFDGWQSGGQEFPEFRGSDMGFLKRSLPGGASLRELLASTLHGLEQAVTFSQ